MGPGPRSGGGPPARPSQAAPRPLKPMARGCVAAATAARGTNDSASSSIRGSGMSAAVIASAHRPSRSATIAAPSGAVHIHTADRRIGYRADPSAPRRRGPSGNCGSRAIASLSSRPSPSPRARARMASTFRRTRAHVREQRLPLGRQRRPVARTVEERDAELGLEVADGVAHRRLDPRQATCGGAEAAGLRDGDEGAHLIESERVQHDLFYRLI